MSTKRISTNIRIDHDNLKWIKVTSAQQGVSMADFVNRMIDKYRESSTF